MRKFVLLLLVVGCMAQDKPDKPKSKYTPTETQALKLENLQLKAKLAQQSWNAEAYKLPGATATQNAISDLLKACQAIAVENNWPKTVSCNADTLQFDEVAEQPKPAPKTEGK